MSTDKTMGEVRAEIDEFIRSEFMQGKVEADKPLADDFDLISQQALDSMNMLRFVAWLEKKYDISIDDDDLHADNFRGLPAICKFVEKLRAGEKPAA